MIAMSSSIVNLIYDSVNMLLGLGMHLQEKNAIFRFTARAWNLTRRKVEFSCSRISLTLMIDLLLSQTSNNQ